MSPRNPGRAVAGHDVNAYLARHVPITQAMGIRLRSFDAAGVTMTAPLKPNINDKGIAFGGTLASILALSGWALTDLVLREAGEVADVLIAVAATEYRAPVAGRIVARCALPPAGELAAFFTAERKHAFKRRLEEFAAIFYAKGYVDQARAALCAALNLAAADHDPLKDPFCIKIIDRAFEVFQQSLEANERQKSTAAGSAAMNS